MASRVTVNLSKQMKVITPLSPGEETARMAEKAEQDRLADLAYQALMKQQQLESLKQIALEAVLEEAAKDPNARQEIKDWILAHQV